MAPRKPVSAKGSASDIIIATASGWTVGPMIDLRPIESTAPSSPGRVTEKKCDVDWKNTL